MNPIEKDLKNYYGTSSDSDILEHYGTKRHALTMTKWKVLRTCMAS